MDDANLDVFLRDLPIVDPHQHFWDLKANGPRYPHWAVKPAPFRYGSTAPLFGRDYLPADYRRDMAQHNVVATVHVQAGWVGDPLGEARWLATLRKAEGLPSVALGGAVLHAPDAEAVLDGLAAFPFLRGIRTKPTADEARPGQPRGLPGSMDDPAWRRGFAALGKRGMICEVQVPWWDLPAMADAARDHPHVPFVLNHTGLPADRSPEGLAGWRRALALLEPFPQVRLKLSGLGLPPGVWPTEENARIVREAIAIIGWQRCMFASNFPVDSLVASFDTIYAGFKQAVRDMPREAIRALFHDNARDFYRIP
ncbi:amidohydrolase family protein [Sabulicella rubraurantiaca]|uniref:amidohydrolase family protein n=1 Tax=Sabulicella rubraurantiaca TaxID=2811429 RepID=UPI001A968AE7|nr:amidohydrolase family protein [Sabulicella rubraurantiaca]